MEWNHIVLSAGQRYTHIQTQSMTKQTYLLTDWKSLGLLRPEPRSQINVLRPYAPAGISKRVALVSKSGLTFDRIAERLEQLDATHLQQTYIAQPASDRAVNGAPTQHQHNLFPG